MSLVALPWLAVCAVYDLRSRTVPAWLTIPPLLVAIIWITWRGSWVLAMLTVSLVFLDDIPWRMRGFLGGFQGLLLMAAWFQTGYSGLILGISLIGIWLFWKLGAYGGADAQALMILALLFQPAVLLPVAIAGGVQGLIQWLRGKRTIPAMLAILIGTSLHLLVHF